MSIVPTNEPMTAALTERILTELAEAHPELRLERLATTDFGRPLLALTLGDGDRRVLYSAAHHGNEWLTATVLLKFAEDLASDPTLLEGAAVTLMPLVDPDGVDLVTGAIGPGDPGYDQALELSRNYPDIPFPEGWKANLNGVDLNLQYPAGWRTAREIKFAQGYTRPGPRDYVGRFPLSQIEAQVLADLTQRVEPEAVIALHSQGEVIYWQYGGIEVEGARALAEEFARVSGYALEDTPYNSSFAGYKDWFIQYFREPGFTIEVGRGENPLPTEQFDSIYTAVKPILLAGLAG